MYITMTITTTITIHINMTITITIKWVPKCSKSPEPKGIEPNRFLPETLSCRVTTPTPLSHKRILMTYCLPDD